MVSTGMIHPFERQCICPPPKREPGEHTKECEDNNREQFIAAWRGARREFYGTPERTN